MVNDTPRTIPFGVQVRLNSWNVVEESIGRTSVTVNPADVPPGEFRTLQHMVEANPHFNVISMDDDGKLIFMMDISLDLVEGKPSCQKCGGGLYLVVTYDGVTLCDVCHAKEAHDHVCVDCDKPFPCGWRHQGIVLNPQCAGCAERAYQKYEAASPVYSGRSDREDFHAD